MAAIAPSFGPQVSVSLDSEIPRTVSPAQELFRFRFSKAAPRTTTGNIFRIYIDPLDTIEHDEIWCTQSPISTGEADGFLIAESDEHIALHTEIDTVSGESLREVTRDAYSRLLKLINSRGYPNLARVWNYFPDINQGPGDNERYKLFTAGRADAFRTHGFKKNHLPAGTAIGSDAGTPFTVSAIATRRSCLMVENPRQVSAYEYPRQYGPDSPSFSRAVVLNHKNNSSVLISGTASIVGHESRHNDNPEQQLRETLSNLDGLTGYVLTRTRPHADTRQVFDSYMRVYLRNKKHKKIITDALKKGPKRTCQVVFLRGDICRHELLLEIEAACQI
jgi:chorismate lyase/3-hydroxybenzoate synthase